MKTINLHHCSFACHSLASRFQQCSPFHDVNNYCIHCFSQWDEGILTMSRGETARLEIEPEWAYGKKGVPDSKYPFAQCWKELSTVL